MAADSVLLGPVFASIIKYQHKRLLHVKPFWRNIVVREKAMPVPLTQFTWTCSDGGYRFEELRKPGQETANRYLTSSVPFGRVYPGIQYIPESALFRIFADLKPEEEQILNFADRYGMLTGGVALQQEKSLVRGELLEVWIREIDDFSFMFRFWEWLKNSNAKELSGFIKWADDFSGVRFESADGNAARWIAVKTVNRELLESFQAGDLIAPGWYQLQHMINGKLDGNVSARLLWNPAKSSGTKSRKVHRGLTLHEVPKDLISALWLQLARAIEGDREYHQCEMCRNWFEVSSPDGGRKDKLYCGTPCRARAWRKAREGAK